MSGQNLVVKFQQHAMVINGNKVKVSYSPGTSMDGIAGITVYVDDGYGSVGLPKEFYSFSQAKNDTDTMTDYFEKTRFRVTPGHVWFDAIWSAAMAVNLSYKARREKRGLTCQYTDSYIKTLNALKNRG